MKKGFIFDLDGVIVTTDDYHYRAWKRMADEEGIYFDRTINERLRGVSRMESLGILLERAPRRYSEEERYALADRKNEIYKGLILGLTPGDILPGAEEFLAACKRRGVAVAIGSSSKNAKTILQKIGLTDAFDVIVDGTDISRSKPDPEVFLKAKERLGAADCIVAEDAQAGVEAALRGGMRVLALGAAASDVRATFRASSLADPMALLALNAL